MEKREAVRATERRNLEVTERALVPEWESARV